MWNADLQVTVQVANFHVILALVIASGQEFGLVCIYGDPYHQQTNAIWDQVANFVHDNLGKPMLCMGDMNELFYEMDKSSSCINSQRLHAFCSLVKICGFFDLGFSGPAYTWTNKRYSSNPIYERLDRGLVNPEWCVIYPNTNVYNLPIIMSDHAPILISTDGTYKQPRKNFKFENWWLMEDDFQDHAKSVWNNSANRPFSARTNYLAGALKRWCRKKKPIQQEINQLEEQIKNIQMKSPQDQDHAHEAALIQRYEQGMTKLTEFYTQRAKKQWARDGDRNTHYFHHAVLKRRRRNTIVSIKDEHNVLHFNSNAIANTFVNYFRYIFSSSNANNGRPCICTHMPQQQQDYTYSIPDKQEIWQTLKEMKKRASPGPDGFNVEFYLATWSWIGDDVTMLVRNFYETGILPPHINDTNIALIPKKLVPAIPSDYRPISLCNVIYKIISKTLANRLKPHLPNYIHPSQQAFIEGRRINNNIIIAQEITHSFALKSWNDPAFMLKIDLAKAFDRLEWNFVTRALQGTGLHGHFINLIHACISSPSFSVIINGQSSARFCSDRGIRQGCPISPYLFVLAINELSLTLQEAMCNNNLTGIKLGPNCPPIHSLMFADDLLVCGHATLQEAIQINNIIHHFCSNSGQTPNWAKSAIIFSSQVQPSVIAEIKGIFPVQDIDTSSIHLGHPLILPSKDRSSAYNFILDKFRSKLSTYKAGKLSHAARLALIKSVFASIPVYYMANILFSKKFLSKLTAVIRTFWWTGVREEPTVKALCLRAWKDICTPKQEGGLGIRNIQATNQSLVLSTAWRIAQDTGSHLYKILKSKYFHDTSIWRAKPNVPKSAFWTAIIKILPLMTKHSFYQLTTGNVSIWSTPWCPDWADIYDHLIIQQNGFRYPSNVQDLWLPHQKRWNIDLIQALFDEHMATTISNTPIISSDEPDILCWDLAPSGICSSKSAYFVCLQALQDQGEPPPRQVSTRTKNMLKQVWKCKAMAPRVQTFAWRILRRAIPT